MALSDRENFLRTVRRGAAGRPEFVPCTVVFSEAIWLELRGELDEVISRHPVLFPDHRKGLKDYSRIEAQKGSTYRDAWGCLWERALDGLEGQVLESPLDDWARLEAYRAPDPLASNDRFAEAPDWKKEAGRIAAARAAGALAGAGVPHGFFLMRLYYLRGFENLMMDIATEEPKLDRLVAMVHAYNRARLQKWLSLGVEYFEFAEDLGTQTASLISPASFARYVTPYYRELVDMCRAKGVVTWLHSDGHILAIADQLIAAGFDILNPQDLCNGVGEIARAMKGRVCIDLDIDRQRVVPFGTPAEIRELVEEEVRTLGSPQGGLKFTVGFYPPTPARNVDAVLSALEEFRTWWWDGRA